MTKVPAILTIHFLLVTWSWAAKIVMIPHFGRSHYMVMSKLGDELTARGHDVVIFVGEEDKFAFGKPSVKVFATPIVEGKPSFVDFFKTISSTENKPLSLSRFSLIIGIQKEYCDMLLSDEHAQKDLRDADLVVGDGTYPCSSLVVDKYGIPHVKVTTIQLIAAIFRDFGISSSPAYIPQRRSGLAAVKGLANRVKNMGFYFLSMFSMEYFLYPMYNEVKLKHGITPGKSIRDTLANVDLVLMQGDFIMDFAQPIPPFVREVGSFLSGPAQPLPAELEKFIQGSGDDGVILVSFGSIVTLTDDVIVIMNQTFSRVKQRVLWKVDKFEDKLSPNIMAKKWLPQNDILGHSKTRLFITHGGANGLAEASYHGVPMICSPFFGDQHDNGRFLKSRGQGEVLPVAKATVDQLVSLINQVIYEERYKKRASHVSRVLKLRPRPPVKKAADLIEYLQAVGDLDHLKPQSMSLPFYEVYMLDVIFVLGLAIAVISYIVIALCRLVCCKMFARGPVKTKMS